MKGQNSDKARRGSVSKVGENLFQVRFRFGRGRRFCRRYRVATEAEAWTILYKEMSRRLGDEEVADLHAALSIGEVADLWETERSNLVKVGWNQEVSRVRFFTKWFGEDRLMLDVRPQSLRRWWGSRVDEGRSQQAVRRDFDSVSAFFGWAWHRGLIETNPAKDCPPPKIEQKEVFGLRREDAKRVLELTAGHPVLEPVYLFALYQGFRRMTISEMRWEHVDLKNRTIFAFHGKTKATRKTYRIHPKVLEWLEAQEDKTGAILKNRFGENFTPSGLDCARKWWNRKHGEDSQLPSFHRLRHTLANLMLTQENPVRLERVSKILGHSGTGITDRLYGHLKPEDCWEDVDAFEL